MNYLAAEEGAAPDTTLQEVLALLAEMGIPLEALMAEAGMGAPAPAADFSALADISALTDADRVGAGMSLMQMLMDATGTPAQPGQAMLRDLPPELQAAAPTKAPTWDPQGLGTPGNVMGHNLDAYAMNQGAESSYLDSLVNFLIGTQYETPGTPAVPGDPENALAQGMDFLSYMLGEPTRAERVNQAQQQATSAIDFVNQLMQQLYGQPQAQPAPGAAVAPSYQVPQTQSGGTQAQGGMGGFMNAINPLNLVPSSADLAGATRWLRFP